MIQKNLKTVQEFKARGDHGPLTKVVLDCLEIMENVVHRPKEPPITEKDWAPLAALVDVANFERIGNFAEEVRWDDYMKLLVRWANSSWWRSYIWRIWEVPGFAFLEGVERSNPTGPVSDKGGYHALNSFCVYEFTANNKIKNLYVYDQRPLEGSPAGVES